MNKDNDHMVDAEDLEVLKREAAIVKLVTKVFAEQAKLCKVHSVSARRVIRSPEISQEMMTNQHLKFVQMFQYIIYYNENLTQLLKKIAIILDQPEESDSDSDLGITL